MNAPYYLLRGGNLFDSLLGNAGSVGYYWASTPNDSSNAYELRVYSGATRVNYDYRYYGFSVRCVAAG